MSNSTQTKHEFYESLCDLQIPEDIKFSPDARHVLYSTSLTWGHKKGKHSVSALWLAETGKHKSSCQITSGRYKDHSPRWNPDGKSIAFISDRAEAGKKWAIYVLNLKDGVAEGEAHAVTPTQNEREISSFEYSPDGATIAYIAADEKTAEQKRREENGEDWDVWDEDWPYARLRLLQLSTRNIVKVTAVPQRHVARFCWSPDGKQIAIVTFQSPHIEEPFLTGCRISVLGGEDMKNIQDVSSSVGIAEDVAWAGDGYLYFRSGTPEGKCLTGSCIYRVSSNSKCDSTAVSAQSNWEKFAFGVDNDTSRLPLVTVGGEVMAYVQQALSDCLYLLPNRLLLSKEQQFESFDAIKANGAGEIVVAIATSDINHPVEVFTKTASDGPIVQLSDHGANFKDQHFGDCKFLTCPSTDKEVTLDNVFISPSPHDKPLPTIVLIHGGPNDRHTNAFNPHYYFWVPYLLRRGYGILMPNYRGSPGKGEDFAFYACRGQGRWDYDDVVAATQHAIEGGYIDKERIMVGGLSQGGFLSYLAAVRNGMHGFGWKYKAAIPVSGVTDTDAMALTSDLGATLETELNNDNAPWKVPKNFVGNRDASALWEFHEAMEESKRTGEMVVPPMLILHGEKDERCPLTQAWGMRRALMSRGLPFEMVTYPRQPHLIGERKMWVDMMERVERWVETYIGPGEKS